MTVPPVRRDRPAIDPTLLGSAPGAGEPVDRADDDEAGLFDLVEQLRRIRTLTPGGRFATDLRPLSDQLRAVADLLEAASDTPRQRMERMWADR